MTNTMVIINGVETAYYSDEPYSNPVFIGVPVAQSVDLCVVFCGPLLFTPCLLVFLLVNV